ncbi:MAG TPA: cobalt ABC transporter [Ruminococcaceae bacterium]|nr:cobalt ABC transporter [Oscillospiraceae bacterium]
MKLIELNHISFSYPNEQSQVLSDFSCAFEKGECCAVSGDNGSGKSTLFRIINGLSFPQNGSYFFDGVEITKQYLSCNAQAKQFHKRIGFLFQNTDVMLFQPTVYDEIAFGPRQLGLSENEIDRRVCDCISLLGLEAVRNKAPYHLSTGQKKRVALASVLSLNPDVLILDEPLAGLDKTTQALFSELFADWKSSEKTLIFATHDENTLLPLIDRTVLLPK